MPLRDDEYAQIKNKRHPTFPGVLRVAIEEKGLVSLSEAITDLRWMDAVSGSSAAGWYALATATAVFKDGDGTERTFTAIGDCGPHNCDRMIAIHAPRMAGTRAKGRALRDALGLEECLSEELGGSDREAPVTLNLPTTARPAGDGRPPTPKPQAPPPASPDPFEKIPAMHVPSAPGAEKCDKCSKALTKNDLTASAANAKFLDGKALCMTHIAERRQASIV